MSCYEWAAGDIVLPSAAFSAVRKTVQMAMHEKWKQAFDDSQRFWKSLTPRERSDWEMFRKALVTRRYPSDTQWLIDPMRRGMEKPRRVLQSDVDWPTSRTTEFHDSDLTLIFQRETRTVRYDVAENNRARDHAAETVLARAFDAAMAQVRWTHGTGGVILGNDEYNREAGYNYEGGGGSYVVQAYGYVGAKEAPDRTTDFLNGKGERVHVETTFRKNGTKVGKVVPGPSPRPGYGSVYRLA